MTPPDLAWIEEPAPGWIAVGLPHAVSKDGFVSGDTSGHRLTVRYFRNELDGSLRAKVLLGPGVQGPPGHAHGGSMAALLDEAMGGAAWMSGHMVVAAELTTRFRKMLPLATRCVIEARVAHVEGRKVRTAAMLRDEQGTLYSEGEALFIVLDAERFGALATDVASLFTPAGREHAR